jgi:hypothetical protein
MQNLSKESYLKEVGLNLPLLSPICPHNKVEFPAPTSMLPSKFGFLISWQHVNIKLFSLHLFTFYCCARPPPSEIIHQYLWPLIDNGCVKEQ